MAGPLIRCSVHYGWVRQVFVDVCLYQICLFKLHTKVGIVGFVIMFFFHDLVFLLTILTQWWISWNIQFHLHLAYYLLSICSWLFYLNVLSCLFDDYIEIFYPSYLDTSIGLKMIQWSWLIVLGERLSMAAYDVQTTPRISTMQQNFKRYFRRNGDSACFRTYSVTAPLEPSRPVQELTMKLPR